MKNILFINDSHDGATIAHIDDLNKLDVNIPEQKDAKDAIGFYLATDAGSATFGNFEIWDGDMTDQGGYHLINILHDVFGVPDKAFMVEHQVHCFSNL